MKRNRKYLRGYTPATVMVCNKAAGSNTALNRLLTPPSCTVDNVSVPNDVLNKPTSQSPSLNDAHHIAEGPSEPDNSPVNRNVQESLTFGRLEHLNHPGLKEGNEPVNRLRRR